MTVHTDKMKNFAALAYAYHPCFARNPQGWICTEILDHEGQHIAGTGQGSSPAVIWGRPVFRTPEDVLMWLEQE